jgi:hypothetical protein
MLKIPAATPIIATHFTTTALIFVFVGNQRPKKVQGIEVE